MSVNRMAGEERELVATTLSRVFLLDTKSVGSDWLRLLAWMLSAWLATPLPEGASHPDAHIPGFECPPAPTSKRLLEVRSMRWEELLAHWETLQARYGIRARLSFELLEALFPAQLWTGCLAVVKDGPADAQQRHELAMASMAKQPSKAAARRGEKRTIAQSTIRTRHAAMRRFMQELCELRSRGYPSPLLAPWTSLPRARSLPGRPGGYQTEAPSRRQLRFAWSRLSTEIEAQFGPIGGAAAAIELKTARQIRRCGGLRALRDAVIFICVGVIGARRDAIARLNRADLRRRGSDPAMVLLRPRKGIDADEVRAKPIPEGATHYFEAYFAAVAVLSGQALAEEEPLLLSDLEHRRRISTYAIYNAIARRVPRAGAGFQLGSDAKGASPHAMRAGADQLVRDGAPAVLAERGLSIKVDVLADILLDHDVKADRYGYGGLATPQGRERYSGLAIEIAWSMLTTDMGARLAVDAGALRQAIRLRVALEAEVRRLETAGEESRREVFERLRGAQRNCEPEALLGVVAEQTQLQATLEEERRARVELTRLDAEIEALENDPRRRVVVPEEASLESVVADPGSIHEEEEGLVELAGGRTARRQRTTISVREFAAIAGVSSATARRWVSGVCLPFPDGDPRNPWRLASIPVLELSARRRLIEAEAINPHFLDSGNRREQLNALLCELPTGWPAQARYEGLTPVER